MLNYNTHFYAKYSITAKMAKDESKGVVLKFRLAKATIYTRCINSKKKKKKRGGGTNQHRLTQNIHVNYTHTEKSCVNNNTRARHKTPSNHAQF